MEGVLTDDTFMTRLIYMPNNKFSLKTTQKPTHENVKCK